MEDDGWEDDKTIAGQVDAICSPYPGAFPTINPVDIFKCSIIQELARITELDAGLICSSLQPALTLQRGDLRLDLSYLKLNIPKPKVKELLTEKAAHWAAAFSPNPLIKPPTSWGTRLEFVCNPDDLPKIVLPLILNLGQQYGLNDTNSVSSPGKRKKIVVEFSSPNIATPFYAGFLRATIIGACLSNLYEGAGWETIRMNYLGDWGWKYGLLPIGLKRYGNEDAFNADPFSHLFEVSAKICAAFQYEEVNYKATEKRGEDTSILEIRGLYGEGNAYFKRMEDGDKEALASWKQFRSISINKYKTIYERININFTDFSGECTVEEETMDTVERVLLEGGIAEHDRGAVKIDFNKHGTPELRVGILRNRNGTSTYLLRDIGAAIQRQETYDMDRMLYIVPNEWKSHMDRLVKALELMGGEYTVLSKKLQHVTYGAVLLKGWFDKPADVILNDAGESMHELLQRNRMRYRNISHPKQVADLLGITAAMICYVTGNRASDKYGPGQKSSSEGEAMRLQSTYSRLCFIQQEVALSREQLLQAEWSLLKEKEAIDLVRLLAKYPVVVHKALETLQTTPIITYLTELVYQFNTCYKFLIGSRFPREARVAVGMETTVTRTALYEAARQTVHNAMVLLELPLVEALPTLAD